MQFRRNPAEVQWNFPDGERKLHALGAINDDPSDFEAIVAERRARKEEISGLLRLKDRDRVLDLGSGMGLIAEVIAPDVRALHCADISETYLEDCRARLAGHPNVFFHRVEYADLSSLRDLHINKVYSTLLFIHFNFYDLVYYLTELNTVLENDGLLYFDYNDGERMNLSNSNDSFFLHLGRYKERRESWIFNCMHMTSFGTLKNIAPQLGFEIIQNLPYENHCFSRILMRKTRDLQPGYS